ncbi:MAG: sialidase family protein [Armatimonadota bacterium]|nr:sialidase family protein [Armatimonadota bacterium]
MKPAIYNLRGRYYSSDIHVDATIVHKHSSGRDLTNQQPCAVILSDGTWMVCWTQATEEAAKDESVVGATSFDGGETWSEPYYIEEAVDGRTASWGMLFAVPHTERVYCFYWFNENAYWLRDAGTIYFRYSEDKGITWSQRYRVVLPRHKLDPDGAEMHGWNTGFPILAPDGAMLLGFTKINEPSMLREAPGHLFGDPDFWWCECFFLRCSNIIREDDPQKLEFTVTPPGDTGLWAPHMEEPGRHFLQEPYMTVLPSGRIAATFRSRTGYPYYSVSDDCGISWSTPRPLRFAPGGDNMKHPCGPCPIYCTRDGRIIFFFRNDNAPLPDPVLGDHLNYWRNRDPFHVTVGRESPLVARGRSRSDCDDDNAGLYFNKPRIILSGTNVDPQDVRPHRTAQYPQILQWADRFFTVYSSEKTDILVKEIPCELLI